MGRNLKFVFYLQIYFKAVISSCYYWVINQNEVEHKNKNQNQVKNRGRITFFSTLVSKKKKKT